MIIKGSFIFMSIGLPIMILYILVIISFIEKKKIYLPLRDVCISAISLDLYVLISEFEIGNDLTEKVEITPLLMISMSLLVIHIAFMFFIKRFSRNKNFEILNIKFTLIRDMYIGIIILMTNAVSLRALIEMAGGIN